MRKVKGRSMPERASTMDIRASLDIRIIFPPSAFNTEGRKPAHL